VCRYVEQREKEGSQMTEVRRFTNSAGDEMLAVETDIHFAEEGSTMNIQSGERELRAFIEREARFLFDGSAEAGGVLSSDVAAYDLVVAALRDGLEDATRAVANANRLDIRQPADRREAMLLLDQRDPTWATARNFDELSNAAKDNVIKSARGLANRLILQRRNRGTAGGGRPKPMVDPFQSQRTERMEEFARQNGHDLSTHQGRRAALDDVFTAYPHLRPRLPRPGDRHHVMPVATMGAGYRLRRGQPPTGEPVGPPGTNPYGAVRPFKPTPHTEQPCSWQDERNSGSGGVGGNLY
jgi:hypothetical protein